MITHQHFGVIYTSTLPSRINLEEFIDAAEYVGVSGIRWPGGTLAEVGFQDTSSRTYYDINADNLLENRSGQGSQPDGLRELISSSHARGLDLMVIVPTLTYASSSKSGALTQPNLEIAYVEYYQFLKKLLVDQHWGDLPPEFTLEIGNEASLHFGDNQSSYGKIANQFLHALDDVLKDYGLEKPIYVAMQMGISRDQSMNAQVIEQIDDSVAHLIDSVRNHELNKNHGLSWDKGWAGLNDAAKQYYTEWKDKTGKTEDELEHYVSAWNTGVPTERDADGAIISPDPSQNDYGMKAVSSVVEMFANFSLLGVDKAAHWGVTNSETHPNITSSVDANRDVEQLIKADVIKLLAESIVNTSIAHDVTRDTDGNHGKIRSKEHFRSMSDHAIDPTQARNFVFEDPSKYVIFSAANRFETTESETDLRYSIDLSHILGEHVEIENVSSHHLISDVQAFSFSDTLEQSTGIVLEKAATERDGVVTVEFSQNYELARIIAFKSDFVSRYETFVDELPRGALYETSTVSASTLGDSGDNILLGSVNDDELEGGLGSDLIDGGEGLDFASYRAAQSGVTADLAIGSLNKGEAVGDTYVNLEGLIGSQFSDRLFGDGSDNFLVGLHGDDILVGRRGNDKLVGDSGSDRLHGLDDNDVLLGGEGGDHLIGGAGIDRLYGGDGEDVFFFAPSDGLDIVYDFEDGTDFIYLEGIVSNQFESLVQTSDYRGNGTMITVVDDRIFIRNVNVEEIDLADFLFVDTFDL